jgi:hypothetical protein
LDGSNDTLSYRRDVPPASLCHSRDDKLQQRVETSQSSFTSSPIKTHDFVIPKEVVITENEPFVYIISQWIQIVQNLVGSDSTFFFRTIN